MRLSVILVFISIFSVITVTFFMSIGEVELGILLSVIMFCWPIGFWALSKVGEGWFKTGGAAAATEPIQQEVVDSKSEDILPSPKKDPNELNENLRKLRKASETLEDEKEQGIINEETYKELKKQNDDAIGRLEKEISG
jgi:hypothetical protein